MGCSNHTHFPSRAKFSIIFFALDTDSPIFDAIRKCSHKAGESPSAGPVAADPGHVLLLANPCANPCQPSVGFVSPMGYGGAEELAAENAGGPAPRGGGRTPLRNPITAFHFSIWLHPAVSKFGCVTNHRSV